MSNSLIDTVTQICCAKNELASRLAKVTKLSYKLLYSLRNVPSGLSLAATSYQVGCNGQCLARIDETLEQRAKHETSIAKWYIETSKELADSELLGVQVKPEDFIHLLSEPNDCLKEAYIEKNSLSAKYEADLDKLVKSVQNSDLSLLATLIETHESYEALIHLTKQCCIIETEIHTVNCILQIGVGYFISRGIGQEIFSILEKRIKQLIDCLDEYDKTSADFDLGVTKDICLEMAKLYDQENAIARERSILQRKDQRKSARHVFETYYEDDDPQVTPRIKWQPTPLAPAEKFLDLFTAKKESDLSQKRFGNSDSLEGFKRTAGKLTRHLTSKATALETAYEGILEITQFRSSDSTTDALKHIEKFSRVILSNLRPEAPLSVLASMATTWSEIFAKIKNVEHKAGKSVEYLESLRNVSLTYIEILQHIRTDARTVCLIIYPYPTKKRFDYIRSRVDEVLSSLNPISLQDLLISTCANFNSRTWQGVNESCCCDLVNQTCDQATLTSTFYNYQDTTDLVHELLVEGIIKKPQIINYSQIPTIKKYTGAAYHIQHSAGNLWLVRMPQTNLTFKIPPWTLNPVISWFAHSVPAVGYTKIAYNFKSCLAKATSLIRKVLIRDKLPNTLEVIVISLMGHPQLIPDKLEDEKVFASADALCEVIPDTPAQEAFSDVLTSDHHVASTAASKEQSFILSCDLENSADLTELHAPDSTERLSAGCEFSESKRRHSIPSYSHEEESSSRIKSDTDTAPLQSWNLPKPITVTNFGRSRPSTVSDEYSWRFSCNPEAVLQYHSCALCGKILLQGKLYITAASVGFYSAFNDSTVFSTFPTLVHFSIQDIEAIKKKSYAYIFQNAIEVTLKDGTVYFFTSFLRRDKAWWLLMTLTQTRVASSVEKLARRDSEVASNSEISSSHIEKKIESEEPLSAEKDTTRSTKYIDDELRRIFPPPLKLQIIRNRTPQPYPHSNTGAFVPLKYSVPGVLFRGMSLLKMTSRVFLNYELENAVALRNGGSEYEGGLYPMTSVNSLDDLRQEPFVRVAKYRRLLKKNAFTALLKLSDNVVVNERTELVAHPDLDIVTLNSCALASGLPYADYFETHSRIRLTSVNDCKDVQLDSEMTIHWVKNTMLQSKMEKVLKSEWEIEIDQRIEEIINHISHQENGEVTATPNSSEDAASTETTSPIGNSPQPHSEAGRMPTILKELNVWSVKGPCQWSRSDIERFVLLCVLICIIASQWKVVSRLDEILSRMDKCY